MVKSGLSASSRAETPPASGLPYDPEEWEHRLAEARARRNEVLRKQPGKSSPAPVTKPAKEISGKTGRPVWWPAAFFAGLLIGVPLGIFIAHLVEIPFLDRMTSALFSASGEAELSPMPAQSLAYGMPLDAVSPAPGFADPGGAAVAAQVQPAPERVPVLGPAAGDPARPAAPSPVPQRSSGASLIPVGADTAALAASPAIASARIVLHVPEQPAEGGLSTAAAGLRQAGVDGWERVPGTFAVNRTHLRYYHETDAPTADALADAIAAPALDFTGYRPSPERGLFEIWIAGR